MQKTMDCPHCFKPVITYRNPIPTVDLIIRFQGGIVLIKRKNPPYGWALPGGFIDYGESAESAAAREAKEETSLDVAALQLFGVYSEPDRDPRHHTLTVVFTADGAGHLEARDDAADIRVFSQQDLPDIMAFDHARILADYFAGPNTARPSEK